MNTVIIVFAACAALCSLCLLAVASLRFARWVLAREGETVPEDHRLKKADELETIALKHFRVGDASHVRWAMEAASALRMEARTDAGGAQAPQQQEGAADEGRALVLWSADRLVNSAKCHIRDRNMEQASSDLGEASSAVLKAWAGAASRPEDHGLRPVHASPSTDAAVAKIRKAAAKLRRDATEQRLAGYKESCKSDRKRAIELEEVAALADRTGQLPDWYESGKGESTVMEDLIFRSRNLDRHLKELRTLRRDAQSNDDWPRQLSAAVSNIAADHGEAVAHITAGIARMKSGGAGERDQFRWPFESHRRRVVHTVHDLQLADEFASQHEGEAAADRYRGDHSPLNFHQGCAERNRRQSFRARAWLGLCAVTEEPT